LHAQAADADEPGLAGPKQLSDVGCGVYALSNAGGVLVRNLGEEAWKLRQPTLDWIGQTVSFGASMAWEAAEPVAGASQAGPARGCAI
jgi:hypothetical protein